MTILVIPDVHGRDFWRTACTDISIYDRVVFLGDYVDPYTRIEHITSQQAVVNFSDLVAWAHGHAGKVELLLGNHDMPYYSPTYYSFSHYHSRHSADHHDEIARLFSENRQLFRLACTHDGVLFTHAGCSWQWVEYVFSPHYRIQSLDDFVGALNNLTNSLCGLRHLYMVTSSRGGLHEFASCIWNDVDDMRQSFMDLHRYDFVARDIQKVRQVFGHTFQVRYNFALDQAVYGTYQSGFPDNWYMLDNASAYVLDTDGFSVTMLQHR